MAQEKDLSKNSCLILVGGVATVVGIIVSAITIYSFVTGRDSLRPEPTWTPAPTPAAVAVIPQLASTVPLPTASGGEAGLAPAAPLEFSAAAVLPANSCPADERTVWLQFPDVWYGPFSGGDAIWFSSYGGFFVWDADAINNFGGLGLTVPYPDPYFQMPRNMWAPLQGSIFYVCVDGVGNVFALDAVS